MRTALGLLPMQSFSGGKPDVDWQDGRLDLTLGEAEKKSVDLAYCQTIPPPPRKGECLECVRVTRLRPVGRWRGDMVGDGDEVRRCSCRWFFGGSTDSSVAEPYLCFLVTTMAEKPW